MVYCFSATYARSAGSGNSKSVVHIRKAGVGAASCGWGAMFDYKGEGS